MQQRLTPLYKRPFLLMRTVILGIANPIHLIASFQLCYRIVQDFITYHIRIAHLVAIASYTLTQISVISKHQVCVIRKLPQNSGFNYKRGSYNSPISFIMRPVEVLSRTTGLICKSFLVITFLPPGHPSFSGAIFSAR